MPLPNDDSSSFLPLSNELKRATYISMSRLAEIINYKRQEISPWIAHTNDWKRRAKEHRNFRGFRTALDLAPFGFIAEVKHASPSAGVITEQFDPLSIATKYYEGGAHCISVITDERYFQGHLDYLALVHQHVPVPTLRKDFIIHEVQIYQAVLAGADAILLIVAALSDNELKYLHQVATSLAVDVMVEVHNEAELERALNIHADFIAINNRDLTTFNLDLRTTERLLPLIPSQCTIVSESGIQTPADVQRILHAGANAVLVGESLMRASDPKKLLHDLLEAARLERA
jgi:indole-3-glycerol phosphate synthase